MKTTVNDHLVACREGFAAKITAVGPRIRVNALVLPQQVATLKVLRAKGALEWPKKSRIKL
jgi:hypothetical protein